MTTDVVAEADRAADLANAEVEILEQAIRDGDTKVKPEQLGRARDIARHAELSREAARTQAERERVAAARRELADAAADLEQAGAGSLRESQEQIAAALADAQAAMRRLAGLVPAHNELVKAHTRRVMAACKALPGGQVRMVARDIYEVDGVRVSAHNITMDGWKASSVTGEAAFCAAIAPVLDGLDFSSENGHIVRRDYVKGKAQRFRP